MAAVALCVESLEHGSSSEESLEHGSSSGELANDNLFYVH